MSLLAIDVGGAGLKCSDGGGYAASRPFALWKNPRGLTKELTAMIATAPSCEHVYATMTGELADCFATKAEGVAHICAALLEAAGPRTLRIYLTDGTVVSAEEACERPLAAAASSRAISARRPSCSSRHRCNWAATSCWNC